MIKVDVLENGSLLILERTVSDSVKFEKIRFSFPESWKDFTKTAVFKNGETAVEILLNSGSDYCTGKDECFVPFEVIKPPFFTVSVFGSRGDTLATTIRGEIEVLESGYELGDEPKEPTQSIYAQILDETKKATQIAQSVRDDADNGKFKGEKGDKGESGNGGVVDLAYNPQSENPQSGKAVAEAISGIEFSGDGGIKVDQNFNPESENAQSGKAVDEAIKTQVGNSKPAEALKEQNKSGEFTVWVGTQAEYDAIDEKVQGCFYIITDDNSRNEIVAEVLNSQKDYIVEQATSDIWTYRKWASGDSECWATIGTTITTTEADALGQTIYIGSSESWNFPANLFKNTPACTYDTYAPGYPMTVINSLTNTAIILHYLTKWAVSGNAKVSIIAKGRWK
ncbi:MAG: hypothetical protein J6B22_02715 [Clostridia bacterium]|nr:hypothetical protein [Clostridia bacterium]